MSERAVAVFYCDGRFLSSFDSAPNLNNVTRE